MAGLLVDIANENLDKKNNHHILSPRTRSNLALQRTTSSLGSTRLKDAVVYGYVMQRHAKRERVVFMSGDISKTEKWWKKKICMSAQTMKYH